MKNLLIILLIGILVFYFSCQRSVKEGFKGGGRRSGHNRSYKTRHRRISSNRPRFYKRSYRRYPYGNNYFYNSFPGYLTYSLYDYLGSPFDWGNPYGYGSYNWFDFRNCPSGCVANSRSPSGFSCNNNGSVMSCQTDFDCSGCNVPALTFDY